MARMEAVPGIEPGTNGYKALVLPLNYTAMKKERVLSLSDFVLSALLSHMVYDICACFFSFLQSLVLFNQLVVFASVHLLQP